MSTKFVEMKLQIFAYPIRDDHIMTIDEVVLKCFVIFENQIHESNQFFVLAWMALSNTFFDVDFN